jgi:hypothetical protein
VSSMEERKGRVAPLRGEGGEELCEGLEPREEVGNGLRDWGQFPAKTWTDSDK